MKKDGWREFIFKDPEGKKTFKFKEEDFILMWVADMEFRAADKLAGFLNPQSNQTLNSGPAVRNSYKCAVTARF